jgi:hypothetical protein
MDTQISSAQLFNHFKFNLEDVPDLKYREIFTSLGTHFSARQLCDALIEQFWVSEEIPETSRDCDQNCFKSSVFAVACAFTNKLNSQYMKEYANNRGGMIAHIQSSNDRDITIISLREIINWMIRQ